MLLLFPTQKRDSPMKLSIIKQCLTPATHIGVLVICFFVTPASAQSGATNGEWSSYGGDAGHTKYSPLDQIDADNVENLQVAWTWTSVDEGVRQRNEIIRERGSFRTYAYEVTPLMVNGVLYTTTSFGQIAAIDPASGETL